MLEDNIWELIQYLHLGGGGPRTEFQFVSFSNM